MLNLLLPSRADNSLRCHTAALWIFAVVVLMKSIISLMSLFDARAVAGGADGIPLDTFTPAGAQAVVTLFAALGLGQLMTCLVWIVALWCYRALVPLLFALLIVDQLSRKLLLQGCRSRGLAPSPAHQSALSSLR